MLCNAQCCQYLRVPELENEFSFGGGWDYGKENFLLVTLAPNTVSCGQTPTCVGADASSGVQMASWETHKLSLAERWKCSLIQSHSLGVQMLSSSGLPRPQRGPISFDGRTAVLRDGNQCQVWAAASSAYSSQCHSRALALNLETPPPRHQQQHTCCVQDPVSSQTQGISVCSPCVYRPLAGSAPFVHLGLILRDFQTPFLPAVSRPHLPPSNRHALFF